MKNNINYSLIELLYKNTKNELDIEIFNILYKIIEKNNIQNNYLNHKQVNKFKAIIFNENENKKELLQNLIIQILISDFLNNYKIFLNDKNHNQKNIIKFLRTGFKTPKIWLSGFENYLDDDETNPFKIQYPNNHFWTFLRCRMYIPQLNNIFYSFNINLEQNKNISNNLKQRYWLENVAWYDELKNNYIFMASEFFGIKDIKWADIPSYLYETLINPKYKSEIIFIYRHICEWIYIDKLTSNISNQFEIEQLNYLKPLITSNFSNFVNAINENIFNSLEQFDYAILNENNSISWKYLPFLMFLFKNVVVLGDSNQLNDVDRNDSIKNIFKLLTNNEQNEFSNLFSNLKLLDTNNNQSIFSWVISSNNKK